MLLDTGNAELLEVRSCHDPLHLYRPSQGKISKDSPRDWFWGVGADGTGNNELGKALMRLRDELRAFSFPFFCVERVVFGWHFMLKGGLLSLTGNEADEDTPTPSIAPTSVSKSTPTSTRNHRSQGHSGKDKRQAPRTHVSGSRGSTNGVCEVRFLYLAAPGTFRAHLAFLLCFCFTSFVVPNRHTNAPSTAVALVQIMLRRCARCVGLGVAPGLSPCGCANVTGH